MARVLLLQLDGKFPNAALLRAAAWHRENGDDVTLRVTGNARAVQRRLGEVEPDRVLASLIFSKTRELGLAVRDAYPQALLGGTGWDPKMALEDAGIPSKGPLDYRDHPHWTASIGFSQRGCRLRCPFCVVPTKEGENREFQSIQEIWRGDPWPRSVLLLDNDFLGQPKWRERIRELRDGRFRVCFTQGINVRTLTDESAAELASVDYRGSRFRERRLYTAFDNGREERRVVEGLKRLHRAGVKPRHVLVYMLVGYWPGETLEAADRRREVLRDLGALPYPMPYVRTPELIGYQRWVVGAYDKTVSWARWRQAGFRPERLGLRGPVQSTLPLAGTADGTQRGGEERAA